MKYKLRVEIWIETNEPEKIQSHLVSDSIRQLAPDAVVPRVSVVIETNVGHLFGITESKSL